MSSHETPRRYASAWLRQHRLWLGGAGALLLLYTLVGFLVVPRIIRTQIEERAREGLGREARVTDVRFNPFTLGTTLSGLRLADRDGAELLGFDRVYVNLEVSGLFRRAWRFKAITIERPSLAARILADGRPSVADLLDAERSAPAEPFTLPRVIVDRLLVTNGVATFADASRQPEYRSRFEPLALDITDLITIPEEGGEHAITIGMGERARLRWTGRQVVEPLRFSGRLDITGLDLHELWDYFAREQQVDLREGHVDLALPYEIRRGASGAFELTLEKASAHLTGLAVRPRDGMDDWLTLPDLRVDDVKVLWPAARAEIASISVAEPRVYARLEEDGRFNWQHAFPPAANSPESSSPSWTFQIGTVDLARGRLSMEAAADLAAGKVDLSEVVVKATGISSNLAAPITFQSSARVQEQGMIEAAGRVSPSPLTFDVTFGASALSLAPLQPYLGAATTARIASGTASLEGKASMGGPARALTAAVEGSLDDVELRDGAGTRLAAWRRMAIDGFTLDHPPNRARIRKVTFDNAFANILIDKQGRLNLTRLGRPADEDVPASAPAAVPRTTNPPALVADAAPARPSPTLEIGIVELKNASAEFADLSLLREFRAQIHSANGTIRDLSSFAAAPATVNVEGRVDKTGFVRIGGTLRTSDPMAASEITVGFRGIEMLGLTPYFAEFSGYAVRSGLLDLDVRYQVQARRLVGTHTLVARDLVLGERVKDSKAPGLALRLAVALLKDREGRINLDVPIQGTVDSPEFNYRQVFWGAVRTILGNAAKAPFRALGRLFGRDEDDLELVEFDPGRSDLLPADQQTLARLSEQLVQRQELSVSVEGRFDPKADPPALRRAKLDRLIDSRRAAAATAAAPGASALETILETLFVEQFSAEALQQERVRAGAPPAASSSPAASSPPAAAAAGAAVPSVPAAPTSPAAPAGAGGTGASGAFDAAAFYEALRTRLLEAQTVTPEDLSALAAARATTIVTTLSKAGSVDGSRVKAGAPAAVKRSKAGSSRIASEMTMEAGED